MARHMNDNAANQYLTFTLDREVFAFDIASVSEVLEYTTITKVPRTAPFITGIINLRGRAVPVTDLRLKFGMPRTEPTVNTCIIIVEVGRDGQRSVIGALTDTVREVIDIEPGAIAPPPRMGTPVEADFLSGLARLPEGFVMVLNTAKVFSQEDLDCCFAAADPAEEG